MEHSKKNNIRSFDNLVVTDSRNRNIGSLMYFTIPKMLIPVEMANELIKEAHLSSTYFGNSYNNTYAFKTATSAIIPKDNFASKYRVRLLENDRENEENEFQIKREIKKEIISTTENKMEHLGNVWLDKKTGNISFNLTPAVANLDYDLRSDILKSVDYYEKIKSCYSEERLTRAVLRMLFTDLDATSVAAYGNIFFIPEYKKELLMNLEHFFILLKDKAYKHNLLYSEKSVISFVTLPVITEKKFIEEYSKDFRVSANKEIDWLLKRLTEIKKNGASQKVIDTIEAKIAKISKKIANYSECLNTELEDLDASLYEVSRMVSIIKASNLDTKRSTVDKNQISLNI